MPDEGALVLTLSFEDFTQDSTPPPMGSCGEELYEALHPLAADDRANGWALAHVCEALGRMRQAVSDIVRDSERTIEVDGREVVVELPGWSLATDVDFAPGADSEIDLLPFLGQLVGVRGIEPLSEDDRRGAIRGRSGFWRGTPSAIVSYAERFTTGSAGAVQLRERYDPVRGKDVDAPYHGQIRVKRSRLVPDADEERIREQLLARVPAGLVFEVEFTDDRDYDDVALSFDDYDDVSESVVDYDDLLSGVTRDV